MSGRIKISTNDFPPGRMAKSFQPVPSAPPDPILAGSSQRCPMNYVPLSVRRSSADRILSLFPQA